jgi:cytochrome c-type biogenesis protein CcmE
MASPKQQRLALAAAAVLALAGAGVIAAASLKDSATYFYAPADLAADPPAAGHTIRLGGLVKEGTVRREADGLTLVFVVTDLRSEVPVRYTGIVPDLFRERQGVIATGSFDGEGHFVARELLAKHDEKYMPPEVAKALDRQLRARAPLHPSA